MDGLFACREFTGFGPNRFDPAPEPLLAPPVQSLWKTLWSSEDLCYGGCGVPPLETDENWRIPGESATVLAPESVRQ